MFLSNGNFYFFLGVNAAAGLSGGNVDAVESLFVAVDNLELPGGLPVCFLFCVSLLIDFILFCANLTFSDCSVFNGSNARSGEVMAVWNNGSVKYTDNSTTDIGTTTDVTMSVSIVSSQAQFIARTNTPGWTIT